MNENDNNNQGRKPNYSSASHGIAIWINKPKTDGKEYAMVNIPLLGLKNIPCFAPIDRTNLDKAKDIVSQSEPAAVVTEEKVE